MLNRLVPSRRRRASPPTPLQARHARFVELRDSGEPPHLWQQSQLPGDGTLPEVSVADLPELDLRDLVARHGAVIVRSLLDPATATQLRAGAESVLQGLEQVGRDGDTGDNWYQVFNGVADCPELGWSRQIATLSNMGALLVDSPRFAETYLSLMDDAGLVAVIDKYLGAPAMLSAEKSVVRRVPATTGTNWHQDGAFLGADVRALNLWVTLSDCGTDAPGLDLVAARPDEILATGTDDALFDWSIGQGEVDRWRGDLPVIHSEFRAGDAVLFDHMLVHRTGVTPGMTETRYALESWFFTPWHFPDGYTGVAPQSS